MCKRSTRKIRGKEKPIRSYKKVEKAVEDTLRDSVGSMRTVSRLDNVFIESMKADS